MSAGSNLPENTNLPSSTPPTTSTETTTILSPATMINSSNLTGANSGFVNGFNHNLDSIKCFIHFPLIQSIAAFNILKNFSPDHCKQDFNGTLACQGVWGKPLFANCKSLVNRNASFCNDENFQKYCCASCSAAKVVNGE